MTDKEQARREAIRILLKSVYGRVYFSANKRAVRQLERLLNTLIENN